MPAENQTPLEPEGRETIAACAHLRRIQAARDGLGAFVEVCGADENGNQIELPEIHKSWIQHVHYCWERGLRSIILAPFGSGKSSTLACPLVAFLIGRNPQLRIQVVCSGDPLARRRVSAIRQILGSPAYGEVFPGVQRSGRRWSDQEFFMERRGHDVNPSVLARGVSCRGGGSRSDVTVFDDVCDQLNSTYEDRRRNVKELINGTWLSRLDEAQGRLLWVATPWHVDDATQMMINDTRSCTLIQRVSANLTQYDQEVINAGSDYEGLAA